MESFAFGDYNNTLIASASCNMGIVNESDFCDYCRYDEGWTPRDVRLCSCVPDPVSNHVAVLIKVQGNPISREPKDSTYEIMIWDRNVPESQCTPAHLYECAERETISPAAHVVLAATVDSSDMEFMNIDVLRKYREVIMATNMSIYHFEGPVQQESYVTDFHHRVNALFTGAERKDETDNAHVGRRQKGHSHYRPHVVPPKGKKKGKKH